MSVGGAGGFFSRAESVGVRVEGGFISSGNVYFDFPECVRGIQGDCVSVGGQVGFLYRVAGDHMVFSLGDVFFDFSQCVWGVL